MSRLVGQTFVNANVVSGKKYYAADLVALIAQMQALNDEIVGSDGAVSITGNETIAGVKTFSSSPVIPAPTTDLQASTKKYVDDNVVSLPSSLTGFVKEIFCSTALTSSLR